jgi:TolB protein
MDLNSYQTQLTYGSDQLSAPEISPDGRFIVITYEYPDVHQGIWLMNRDGSNLHQLYDNPPQDAVDPTWSPDGSQILFAYGSLDNKQMMVINREGSYPDLVSDEFATRGRSDWSVDGVTLVGYSGTSWYRELYIFNIDGSNLHKVTNGWLSQNPPYGNSQGPSFSPDGKWIAFTAYPQLNNNDGCEIYIMRVDGTDVRRLTNNNYCDFQPRWGP